MFLDRPIIEKLNNDGIYVNIDNKMTKISIPLIMDDEIKRVVEYEKNKNK